MSVENIPNENESLELLHGMMGESFDADVARRVLKKFGGDLNQAAAAILEGDTGESALSSWQKGAISQVNYNSQASGSSSGALNAPQRTNTPCPPEESKQEKEVIDLTGDYDAELHQALALSLENESQSQAVFGPSTRAPDPNWAVVPSNVPAGTILTDAQTQEEQSLSRAIEASLSTSFLEDKFEELPPEDRILQSDHPVALRTSMTELYFTTLVIHALYHVPQVREQLASWQPRFESGIATDDIECLAAHISFIFTFMDNTIMTDISIDSSLHEISAIYPGKRANSASESPGDLSDDFYTFIVRAIEDKAQEARSLSSGQWDRLFHLRYAPTNVSLSAEDVSPNALGLDTPLPISSPDIACVKVDVRGTEEGNDLLSCLSRQLGLDGKEDSANISGLVMRPQSLVAPSEVVAFHLIRQSQGSHIQAVGPVSQVQADAHPFRYPKHVYLDQFLRESVALADEKRALRKEMQKQIKELTDKKTDITNFKGKDTIKSLTSAVYYFENVASRDGTPTRGEEVKSAAMDLRKILTQVENEIQALDTQISRLRTLCEKVFDDPALRNHRYDLRAVLVHDGLFGRNHIYSFVQHNGKWWKTQDYSVVEVSEELVLTDSTGLHLGAGPYMLIYSRETEEHDVKSEWPRTFKDNCEAANQRFIDALEFAAPETAARLRASYQGIISHTPPRSRKLSSDTSIESTSTIRGPSRSMSVISVNDDEASTADTRDNESQSTDGMQLE